MILPILPEHTVTISIKVHFKIFFMKSFGTGVGASFFPFLFATAKPWKRVINARLLLYWVDQVLPLASNANK